MINIDKSLVDEYLGKGFAISPVIITELARLKFHKPLIHKIYLQAINIDKSLVDDYLGKGSAISPVIITEPVRRKFHKPLIHKIPVPTCGDSKVNVQSLRILFSLSGKETYTSSCADPEGRGV